MSVERETGERLLWAGGSNRGTVNFAEAMAYLTPLEHFAARELDRRENGGETRAYNVHIVTDSEYCRNTGRAGVGVGKNAGVWAAFTAFLRRGFVLHWHWMGRGGCDLNIYCDAVSKMVRRGVEGYNLSAGLCVDGAVTTPYDVNP